MHRVMGESINDKLYDTEENGCCRMVLGWELNLTDRDEMG